MKKIKPLIINYIVLILISLISLFSFKQKGNDFFVALSSLSADIALVFSIIIIIYALLFCCSICKCNKDINKNIIKSLLIILSTIVIIFISFVNIYSHKNLFEYIIRIFNGKENLDIIILFLESLFVYIFIYLCSLVGILLSNHYNKYKKIGLLPIILISVVLLIIMILVNIKVKLLLFIWIVDILIYIFALLIIKKDSLLK